MLHKILFPYHLTTFLLLIHLTSAQKPTIGPQATVSIASLPGYSTARPCAQTCVKYYGPYHCDLPGSYHDVAYDLGCGCSPQNHCLCSAGLKSRVSSYLTSCVSGRCGRFEGWEQDVTSMVGLYDSYCATANVEVSSSAVVDTVTTSESQESVGSVTTPVPNLGSLTTAKRTGTQDKDSISATETKASDAEEKEKEDEGLSKSDVIALSTALGVGIPSLLVGGLALWFQLRKRDRTAGNSAMTSSMTPNGSQTYILPHYPNPHINVQSQTWR